MILNFVSFMVGFLFSKELLSLIKMLQGEFDEIRVFVLDKLYFYVYYIRNSV